MNRTTRCMPVYRSPSSRRAWIEIQSCRCLSLHPRRRPPRRGRGSKSHGHPLLTATRCVALLAEGVDRNLDDPHGLNKKTRSPSSRRAWIEIPARPPAKSTTRAVALLAEGVDRNSNGHYTIAAADVALLAEGVDRNLTLEAIVILNLGSPSSRRVWIEIGRTIQVTDPPGRRPPRGGRG